MPWRCWRLTASRRCRRSTPRARATSRYANLKQALIDGESVIVTIKAQIAWGRGTPDMAFTGDHAITVLGIDTVNNIVYVNDSAWATKGQGMAVRLDTVHEGLVGQRLPDHHRLRHSGRTEPPRSRPEQHARTIRGFASSANTIDDAMSDHDLDIRTPPPGRLRQTVWRPKPAAGGRSPSSATPTPVNRH